MQQVNDVTYPPGNLLVNQDVQDCLYKYFFDGTHNKFLPPAPYQTKILKHIIEEIEKSCRDPDQDVGFCSLRFCASNADLFLFSYASFLVKHGSPNKSLFHMVPLCIRERGLTV